MWLVPLVNVRYGLWIEVMVRSTFRSTPPRASVTSLKPPKSIAITWSIRTSVKHSTVRTASGRPPNANAALIFAREPESQSAPALSGIGTYRSRGMETR